MFRFVFKLNLLVIYERLKKHFNENLNENIYEQAEAEVVPSSSLVEVGVEVEVGLRLRLGLTLRLRLMQL